MASGEFRLLLVTHLPGAASAFLLWIPVADKTVRKTITLSLKSCEGEWQKWNMAKGLRQALEGNSSLWQRRHRRTGYAGLHWVLASCAFHFRALDLTRRGHQKAFKKPTHTPHPSSHTQRKQ
uniref:Uncharacterized protein n=1 Tax=Pipistrellus kuhlii TaxID=59472 RepID=A0A7J7YM78_PIPKU|nr:hypothetical protein mPipKuh1_010090 [Pipistrellus kuhlii]